MKHFLYSAIAAAVLATSVSAAPVTYTLAGNFTATLDGSAINVAATFTGIGDTSTIVDGDSYRSVVLTSLTAVAGGVTFVVTEPSEFFANVNGVGGFFSSGGDFLDFAAPALSAYNPSASLGATPVTLDYTSVFQTDQGEIEISSASDLTFSASVAAVPEPGTWSLMITGFAATGLAVRRRRRAATA